MKDGEGQVEETPSESGRSRRLNRFNGVGPFRPKLTASRAFSHDISSLVRGVALLLGFTDVEPQNKCRGSCISEVNFPQLRRNIPHAQPIIQIG
jgi:hypothetical protein